MSQSSALILDAASFAAACHAGQRRKHAGNEPYVNHPLAVAREIAATAGIDNASVLAAALLHDVIEDSDTTAEQISERFGASVAEMVVECTDDKSMPRKERRALQVEHAPNVSPGAKLIKLADKLCNVRDIASADDDEWPLKKRRRYLEWANEVVAALGQVNESLERAYWAEAGAAVAIIGESKEKEKAPTAAESDAKDAEKAARKAMKAEQKAEMKAARKAEKEAAKAAAKEAKREAKRRDEVTVTGVASATA